MIEMILDLNTREGGNHMAAEQAMQKREKSQTEDVREYIELLKGLTQDEKIQLKGIMIGMQMQRELSAALTA